LEDLDEPFDAIALGLGVHVEIGVLADGDTPE